MTRKLVPRADNEGGLGTAAKRWASAFIDLLTLTSEAIIKHITTPANPSAGYIKIYAKSDDKIYKKTSAGVESEVGAGTGDMLKTTYDTDIDGRVDVAEGINDGTYSATAVNIADAVTKKHVQSHSIVSTADHTSAATSGQILKADANGLPINATNTDADVASAVSLKHTNLSVRGTFTNASLSAGVLTVTHSWGLSSPYQVNVVIVDNNLKVILPNQITCATNSAAIDLSSYGSLVGTWGYLILG